MTDGENFAPSDAEKFKAPTNTPSLSARELTDFATGPLDRDGNVGTVPAQNQDAEKHPATQVETRMAGFATGPLGSSNETIPAPAITQAAEKPAAAPVTDGSFATKPLGHFGEYKNPEEVTTETLLPQEEVDSLRNEMPQEYEIEAVITDAKAELESMQQIDTQQDAIVDRVSTMHKLWESKQYDEIDEAEAGQLANQLADLMEVKIKIANNIRMNVGNMKDTLEGANERIIEAQGRISKERAKLDKQGKQIPGSAAIINMLSGMQPKSAINELKQIDQSVIDALNKRSKHQEMLNWAVNTAGSLAHHVPIRRANPEI